MKQRVIWQLGAAVSAVVLAVAGFAASARAGTYTVVQCAQANRDHEALEAPLITTKYDVVYRCGDAPQDNAIKLRSVTGARKGNFKRFYWHAPDGTTIKDVSVQAKLRRASGHASRLYMANAYGRETRRIATGTVGGTTFGWHEWHATGLSDEQQQLSASLVCVANVCPANDEAKTWVRGVRLTLRDRVAPAVLLEGSLLSGGWRTETHALDVTARDVGGGVRRLDIEVNGVDLVPPLRYPCGEIERSGAFRTLAPCAATQELHAAPNTEARPFHDGENLLHVCAWDPGAVQAACEQRPVLVDNTPPALRFPNTQDGGDPELIRVPFTERHSGIAEGRIWFRQLGMPVWRELPTATAAGELRARVDSAAEVPGDYEFRARAVDRAGNEAETTSRENGEPMMLTFPLRAGTEISAHLLPGSSRTATIQYGSQRRLKGRLTTAAGRPLRGEPVAVIQRFGPGALVNHRVRTASTDDRGYFRSRLPRGPSRRVEVRYGGSPKYLGDRKRGIRMRVRSKVARFRVSNRRVREGRAVVFRGAVRHYAARIPDGGKRIALLYRRAHGDWRPVDNDKRTREDGRFRIRFPFVGDYTDDFTWRFRIQVKAESNWPYRPARSAARKVTVDAR